MKNFKLKELLIVLSVITIVLIVLFYPRQPYISHYNYYRKTWNSCLYKRSEAIELINNYYLNINPNNLYSGCLYYHERISLIDRYYIFPNCVEYVGICQHDIYDNNIIELKDMPGVGNCFYDCETTLKALDVLETLSKKD